MKELLSVGEVAEELMVDSLINKDQWNSFKIQKMYSEYYIKNKTIFCCISEKEESKVIYPKEEELSHCSQAC